MPAARALCVAEGLDGHRFGTDANASPEPCLAGMGRQPRAARADTGLAGASLRSRTRPGGRAPIAVQVIELPPAPAARSKAAPGRGQIARRERNKTGDRGGGAPQTSPAPPSGATAGGTDAPRATHLMPSEQALEEIAGNPGGPVVLGEPGDDEPAPSSERYGWAGPGSGIHAPRIPRTWWARRWRRRRGGTARSWASSTRTSGRWGRRWRGAGTRTRVPRRRRRWPKRCATSAPRSSASRTCGWRAPIATGRPATRSRTAWARRSTTACWRTGRTT